MITSILISLVLALAVSALWVRGIDRNIDVKGEDFP